MPKVSGRELISAPTEKSFRALILASCVAVLTKAYDVPFGEMNFLGAKLPQTLFDVVMLVTVFCLLYTHILKWLGDVAAFRLWYNKSSIWSEFGTDLKLDKTFINGGIQLLRDLHKQKLKGSCSHDQLPIEAQKQIDEFEKNVELYAVRLNAAGTKFAMLSAFGHFYVWGQYFVVPVGLAAYAIYLLLKYGSFVVPIQL